MKAAHSGGLICHEPFELWKNHAHLVDSLRGVLGKIPPFDLVVVAMTGELCDCFETKREGVNFILDAVEAAANSVPIQVWQTDGTFTNTATAKQRPLLTAAANWLALGTFAGRFVPEGSALVIDIGSTTTDIIPLLNGKPVPQGRTDPERLQTQELLYLGVRRTPVCALLGTEGAAEFFATTHDVYLVLGSLAEDPDDLRTADGRPSTRQAALARLARMLLSDRETCSESDLLQLARSLADRQASRIRKNISAVAGRLPQPVRTVVTAGSGEFLARAALVQAATLAGVPLISLADRLSPRVSKAACAYALAMLAQERSDVGQ